MTKQIRMPTISGTRTSTSRAFRLFGSKARAVSDRREFIVGVIHPILHRRPVISDCRGRIVGKPAISARLIRSQLDPEVLDPAQDTFKNRFSSQGADYVAMPSWAATMSVFSAQAFGKLSN